MYNYTPSICIIASTYFIVASSRPLKLPGPLSWLPTYGWGSVQLEAPLTYSAQSFHHPAQARIPPVSTLSLTAIKHPLSTSIAMQTRNNNFEINSISHRPRAHLFPAKAANLLPLLHLPRLFHGLTPQPQPYKREPPSNRNPNPGDPHPRTTNLPTPWPFVMGKVPDRHGPLFIHIGIEGSLVIDAEVEDAMLIWQFERGGVDCAICCLGSWCEGESVKGGEHGEFELERVARRWCEGGEVVLRVLGELDGEGLAMIRC